MPLHELPKITKRKKKRVGRGPGSGKGKTAGRGMKGQKARSKTKLGFEGGQLRLTKRLPFIRGRGFSGAQRNPATLNLSQLNRFPPDTKVTAGLLQKEGLVPKRIPYGIKILGRGELKKKITLDKRIKFSQKAKEKILAQEGKVEKNA